jgi:transcriptional regulator with XRE-family HTH domain
VSITTAGLLLEHFLAWQKETGERQTLKEFAEYIGMSDKQLNHFFTGRREPGEKTAILFATKFSDHRFYDAVSIPRPDPNLKFIQRHWGDIPNDVQKQITKMLTAYTNEPLPHNGENETTNT